jgi:hypothetical protein
LVFLSFSTKLYGISAMNLLPIDAGFFGKYSSLLILAKMADFKRNYRPNLAIVS